ncbi:hypothetical protein ABFY41_16445 [Acinetobacter haemolyticus]|uniref:hypothetical protein n=1 Tax=Acinetobacter haemolyticus TaxID=29430 RepID=UPI003D20B8D7
MKFDFRFNSVALVLCALLLVILYSALSHVSLLATLNVHLIENLQAILLLICVPFTWFYMRPKTLTEQKKWFWLWAMAWWLMFFGRSISWGRDYFPEVPHLYFRMISIVVIAPVVFMLFSPKLRAEIKYKFQSVKFPFWYLIIAVVSLLFADSVEHHRMIDTWIFNSAISPDIVEELYEFPFLLALFFSAFFFMQKDRKSVVKISISPMNSQQLSQ